MRNTHISLILTACIMGTLAATGAIAAKPVKGGIFYRNMDSDPTTLNPITSADAYASEVHAYVFGSLLGRNSDTYAWEPSLATKWEIAKDGTSFTFKLREGVKWHDGKPLTAEDVKFSFDVYFQDKWIAPHKKLYLEKIKEVVIVNPTTIKFLLKEPYFKNFEVVASNIIIPKHFYSGVDVNDPKFNKQLVGTGPFKLEEWERGQKITLKRFDDFWGKNDPIYKDWFNFDRIFFRPVPQIEVALELLKKGNLDYLDLSRNPDQFVEKTKGEEWGPKGKVRAVQVENASTENFDYGFIGWNEKHPFFKDREARVAMSHLVNRDLMIEKFRYNMSTKAVGPWGNKSPASSPNVKAIEYDPKKALQSLEKIGWKLQGDKLVKVIDGKETPFEFTLISANPAFDRYATVMREDMKKIGITMNIKILEWNSFIKLVDERKFDACNMGWQVNNMEQEPRQIWHSSAIAAPGHNFISYSNKKVDDLIDKLVKSMDEKVRRKYYREIHEIIAADQPYTFLFNRKYTLYTHTNRVKKPKDTFKYEIGINSWWIGE